ncbi:MAG: electron transport complex subunit RsxG [Candidatus Pelagadaptatus aseana]|uniref:electron transport complex subunit RsxG n=1 Tax=Candidatus Pelagadaptatus aseana TaxID=3120508 RepID=UPI0039B2B494
MSDQETDNQVKPTAEPTVGNSIAKNSVLLGVFALITAALLSGTYSATAERIAAAERANAQKALLQVIPLDRHNNDLLETTQTIDEKYWQPLGLKQGGNLHIAQQDEESVAVIYPATAPDGYSGDIKMIVGINRDGTIAGVRILSHAETPGLGDKIDLAKSDWILGFNGKSLQSANWAVKKDGGEFDAFAGATITPRAVVNQIKRALKVYQDSLPLAAVDTQEASES